MAYSGLFKDRNPSVKAAGFTSYKPSETVASCMNYISLSEEIDAIVRNLPKSKKEYPEPKPVADLYTGYYTKVRSLLSPERKRLFQDLESELKETAYGSYWNKELGALPDQVPGLPLGMKPYETTFGIKTKRSCTVQEVLNPKITAGEVNLIAELGHELYKKSHNSYFAGEQKSNNYSPLLHPERKVHGIRSNADPAGKLVSKSLTWHDIGSYSVVTKNLASYRQRNAVKIGKPHERNDYLSKLPKDYAFGARKPKKEFDVEQSLKEYDLNAEKKLLNNSLIYLNGLRRYLKKQDPPFSFTDFTAAFKTADQKSCDCVPLEIFYKICQDEGIKLKRELIEPYLKRTGVKHGKNDFVNYSGFVKIIDIANPLPDMGKLEDLSKELQLFETSYHSFQIKDTEKKEAEKLKPAGIPVGALRYGYNYLKDAGLIRANLHDFPTSSTVEQCISPSLFTGLKVSHRDFFQPRSKEYIRGLYERINVVFPDEIFDKLWDEAVRRDGDMACIETFRNVLDELSASRLLHGTND